MTGSIDRDLGTSEAPISTHPTLCRFRCCCLSSLGACWGRFWTPKMTLRTSKTLISLQTFIDFEISTFYLSRCSWERFGGLLGSFWVLLGVSWGSLGRPVGALGGLFGDLWGLQIEHHWMTRIESMSLGALDVFC